MPPEGTRYAGGSSKQAGLDIVFPDAKRVASLAKAIKAGAGDRLVVSHDSVWCWKGNPWPVALRPTIAERFVPTRFDTEIIPKLVEAGVDDDAIHRLTHDNPRHYFEGRPLDALATEGR